MKSLFVKILFTIIFSFHTATAFGCEGSYISLVENGPNTNVHFQGITSVFLQGKANCTPSEICTYDVFHSNPSGMKNLGPSKSIRIDNLCRHIKRKKTTSKNNYRGSINHLIVSPFSKNTKFTFSIVHDSGRLLIEKNVFHFGKSDLEFGIFEGAHDAGNFAETSVSSETIKFVWD